MFCLCSCRLPVNYVRWSDILDQDLRREPINKPEVGLPLIEERLRNLSENKSNPTPSKKLADNLNNVHLMTPSKDDSASPAPVAAPIKFELEENEAKDEAKPDLTACPPPSPQRV